MQGGQIRSAVGRGKARKALWRNWGWSPTQRDMSSSSPTFLPQEYPVCHQDLGRIRRLLGEHRTGTKEGGSQKAESLRSQHSLTKEMVFAAREEVP